jgi:hypothetical protein
VDVRWSFYDPYTGWVGPGDFMCDMLEKTKIIDHKNRCVEIVRQTVLVWFSDNQIRARLADGLTRHVKSGKYANRTIAGVSGTGDIIEVGFKE